MGAELIQALVCGFVGVCCCLVCTTGRGATGLGATGLVMAIAVHHMSDILDTPSHLATRFIMYLQHAPLIWRFRFIMYLKHAPSHGESGSPCILDMPPHLWRHAYLPPPPPHFATPVQYIINTPPHLAIPALKHVPSFGDSGSPYILNPRTKRPEDTRGPLL